MRLSPAQRGLLADRLLESLRESEDLEPKNWEQEWTAELSRRLDHDDGRRVKLSDTLTALRERLAERR